MLPIVEELLEEYPDALLCDGYDDCIIGICHSFGKVPVVAYDYTLMIEKLCKDMSEDEAYEFFEFNIIGSYMGEHTPVFIEVP